jgi:hypothetical protein
MVSIATRATLKLVQLLAAPSGLNTNIAALAQAENVTLATIPASYLFTDNVPSDIAEKSLGSKYTSVYIYCEKIANTLKEKFRSFSGTVEMAIEVRVSQDRLEGIDRITQLYTDALTQTLNQNRGDWGQGLFYSGTFEISFGTVKHGGSNFLKIAKVSLGVDASVD